MSDLPQSGPTLDRLVRITIGGDLAVSTGAAGTTPSPPVVIGLDGMSVKVKRGYSLNKLYSTYNGPAVRVFDTLDSERPHIDIGFIDNQLDVIGMIAYASGSTLGIDRWYDQSGNGKDALSISGITGTPFIVNNGNPVFINGHPCIVFGGSCLQFDNSDAAQTSFTISTVFQSEDSGSGSAWYGMNGIVYSDTPGPVNDFGLGILNNELTLGMGPLDTFYVASSATPVVNPLLHIGWCTQDMSIGLGKVYVDSLTFSAQHSMPTVPRSDSPFCYVGQFGGTHPAPNHSNCEVLVFDSVLDESDMEILFTWQSQYTAGQ